MRYTDLKYLLITLGLLFGVVQGAKAADRFYMNAVHIVPGGVTSLDFSLDNENEYFGFQADLVLPDGLELESTDPEDAITLSSSRIDGSYMLNSNVLPDGAIRFGIFSLEHAPLIGNSGVLFSINVKASPDFDGGVLTMRDILFIGKGDQDVEFPSISETMEIEEPQDQVNNAFIPDFNISIGESKEISIQLDNETEFTAFQIDIVMPEGLTIQDKSFKLSSRATKHTVSSRSYSGGLTRVACLSPSSTPFAGNTGAIVSFTVVAGDDLAETSKIELKNLLFSTPDAKEYELDGSTTTVTAEPRVIEVSGVTLDRIELSMTEGDTATLIATVVPDDATDKTVTWTSSDEAVATVDAEGNVTAVKAGTAVITVTTANGLTATCAVTVAAKVIEVTGITLDQTEIIVTEGNNFTLIATITPEDATDKTVIWSSSDETVAYVDSEGNVNPRMVGTAIITATSVNGLTASCTVTVMPAVIDVKEITLDITELNIVEGESAVITATITPDDATDKTVTWMSSDEEVAYVYPDGTVVAIKVGTAIITAMSFNGVSASCTVNVLPILVESLTIDPTEWTGVEGSEFKITATVLPENATDKTLSFESSDTTVATVDAEGTVKVLKNGSCVITVSTTDGSDLTAECVIYSTSGVDAVFGEDASVDVYDMNGALLKKEADRADLKQLTPGAYILRSGDTVVKTVVR